MSFGEELKRERELREITLREVSESTKISLRYLEALEQNEFENLPGGVFNRGFVRAYSQFIGVDPETMVDAYIMQENSQLGERRKDAKRGADERSGARRFVWLWWVAGLLLIGAAAYWGWTHLQGQQPSRNDAAGVEERT
ncbi:MAG: hypothetical protein GTN89_08935 [Acidobacteria bacterium]|nr:hypothetical protein [Acidobacteriota bacterium]NIM60090.1 hypothetical protein [Acidobacteriota bacterium]NIO59448.1 hypothetical protein [Acidobacteriota bacterium]NIQ30479.1 hypothetical protein [Acidobacteriota bacterium]NIQ85418.1 hypothetical protein [Acidobacteriota bacterium]